MSKMGNMQKKRLSISHPESYKASIMSNKIGPKWLVAKESANTKKMMAIDREFTFDIEQ